MSVIFIVLVVVLVAAAAAYWWFFMRGKGGGKQQVDMDEGSAPHADMGGEKTSVAPDAGQQQGADSTQNQSQNQGPQQ